MTPDEILQITCDAFGTGQYEQATRVFEDRAADLAKVTAYREWLDSLSREEWRKLRDEAHEEAQIMNIQLTQQCKQLQDAIAYLLALCDTLAANDPAKEPAKTAVQYLMRRLAAYPSLTKSEPSLTQFQTDTIRNADCAVRHVRDAYNRAQRQLKLFREADDAKQLLGTALREYASSI